MSKIPLDGLNGLGWSAFTVVLQHYYASVAGCSCAIMSLQPFDILSLLTWGSYALKRWDQPAFFGRSKNPHHYFVATKSSDAQSIICHSRSFKVICSTISLCIRRHTRSIVLPNDFFSIWSRKNDEKGWKRMKQDEKGWKRWIQSTKSSQLNQPSPVNFLPIARLALSAATGTILSWKIWSMDTIWLFSGADCLAGSTLAIYHPRGKTTLTLPLTNAFGIHIQPCKIPVHVLLIFGLVMSQRTWWHCKTYPQSRIVFEVCMHVRTFFYTPEYVYVCVC